MKKNKIVFGILLLLILCSFSLVCFGFSTASFHPDTGGTNKISKIGGTITSYIKKIGIFISVGAAIVMGIKFVTASPEGKGQIKERIIPFVIGIVLIFGFSLVLQPVIDLVNSSGLGSSSSSTTSQPTNTLMQKILNTANVVVNAPIH